jgi:hypothetical protein
MRILPQTKTEKIGFIGFLGLKFPKGVSLSPRLHCHAFLASPFNKRAILGQTQASIFFDTAKWGAKLY